MRTTARELGATNVEVGRDARFGCRSAAGKATAID
jgi:hypothetical protein